MQRNDPSSEEFAFVYSYCWHEPAKDVERALNILNFRETSHAGSSCYTSEDDYQEVQYLLAGNPNTPSAVLEHMSMCSEQARILERVAANPNATAETLKRLAHNANEYVREAVSENLNCDLETLVALAEDEHTDVRFNLAENHNVPPEILDKLCNDDNPYVAYRAQRTRNRITVQTEAPEQLPTQRPQRLRRAAQQ